MNRRTSIDLPIAVLTLLSLTGASTAHADWQVEGFLAARLEHVDALTGWLDGGYGLMQRGGRGGLENEVLAHLGVDWRNDDERVRVLVHGSTDAGRGRTAGRTMGLVQAFVDVKASDQVSIKIGQFFLPGSQEAVLGLWQSPYTRHLSALNSWIGEEIRPIGVDVALQLSERWEIAATIFGGNDTAGTLIGWRGFSYHDRLSRLGETLRLPPLNSLSNPNQFGAFQRDGTQPFGSDLDGRPGWSTRIRFRSDQYDAKWLYWNNRGDRELHRDQYAWHTRFHLLGGEWRPNEDWNVAGEWLRGDTRMGFPGMPWVNAGYQSGYLLGARRIGSWQVAMRYDRFRVVDRAPASAEDNDERGEAVTLALSWQARSDLRLLFELLHGRGSREALLERLPSPARDADVASVEARWWF